MTPEEAPVNMIVLIGHPANGRTATKRDDGRWYTNHDGQVAEVDARGVTDILFDPREHH